MENKNSNINIEAMKEFEFDIMTLKKLWDEDVDTLNLDEVKADKVYSIIKKKHMKCKEYLEKRLFKSGDGHYFIDKSDNISYFKSECYAEWKMIPKELRRWFVEEVEPYRVISDIDKPTIDHKGKTINTFPPIRFDIERLKKERDENEKKENKFVKEYLNFVKFFICAGNEELYEWTLDYLYCLLHGIRTEMIIYLYGEEGTGKSMFLKSVANLVGRKRCKTANVKKFISEFTEFKRDKQVVFIEETVDLKAKNSGSTSYYSEGFSQIKTTCSESYNEIHGKFKSETDMKLFINILMSSNYLLEKKDAKGRRFAIYNVASKKKFGMDDDEVKKIDEEEKKVFSIIGETLKQAEEENQNAVKDLGELFLYLHERKPNSIELYKNAPKTEIKNDVVDDAECNTIKFIKSELEKNKLNPREERTQLYARYCQYCKDKQSNPAQNTLFYSQVNLVECIRKDSNGKRYFLFDVEKLRKNFKIEVEKEENIDEGIDDKVPANDEAKDTIIQRLQERIKELETLLKEKPESKPEEKKETKEKPKGEISFEDMIDEEFVKPKVKSLRCQKKEATERAKVRDILNKFF